MDMRYILNINTRNFRKQLNINKYEVKLPPLSNIEKQYMNVHVEIFKIYKLIYTRLLYVKKTQFLRFSNMFLSHRTG